MALGKCWLCDWRPNKNNRSTWFYRPRFRSGGEHSGSRGAFALAFPMPPSAMRPSLHPLPMGSKSAAPGTSGTANNRPPGDNRSPRFPAPTANLRKSRHRSWENSSAVWPGSISAGRSIGRRSRPMSGLNCSFTINRLSFRNGSRCVPRKACSVRSASTRGGCQGSAAIRFHRTGSVDLRNRPAMPKKPSSNSITRFPFRLEPRTPAHGKFRSA